MTHALENAIEKSIDIYAPLHTVYDQWTHFEDYPRFMEGVLEVKRLDETRLQWRTAVGDKVREWDSTITEQTPDTRIAWKSSNSAVEDGMVSFTTIYEGTRVTLQMTFDPERLSETVVDGDPKAALARRVEVSLLRFKELIEARGTESGSGRGEIQGAQVINERAADQGDIIDPGQAQPRA